MADLYMLFPEGKIKTLTLSYDDGVEQDKKLIEILDRYKIKASFNISAGLFAPEGTVYPPDKVHRRMTASEVRQVYAGGDYEIATHGYTHPMLSDLPGNILTEEISRDRKELEDMFGTLVRGHAYPYGAYNDSVVEVLKNSGICYARTVVSSHNFEIPKDWLRLNATCHHDDPKLMDLAYKFLNYTPFAWGGPKMFYLWGHSYEFEANFNWPVIEQFCSEMSNNEEIWYATTIQIYDYVKAYERLIFDTSLTICYNPTATDVWFSLNGEVFKVPAGKTINLRDVR